MKTTCFLLLDFIYKTKGKRRVVLGFVSVWRVYVASSFSGSTATPAPTKRRSALFPSLEATTTKTTATVALLFFFHSWLDSFILSTSHLSFSLLDSLDVRTVSSFFFFFCHFTQCLHRYIFSSFCVFFFSLLKRSRWGHGRTD